jgi:uncharacterized protein with PQ loop repeat
MIQSVFPSLEKRGQGRFFKEIIHKIPYLPLFQRGRLESRTFHKLLRIINMADIIGWIGSIAFAVCGVPQAWECHKNKSAQGINRLFIALWLTGEVCYVVSVLMKFGWVHWMMFNYTANIFSITVIIYYLIRDKRQ